MPPADSLPSAGIFCRDTSIFRRKVVGIEQRSGEQAHGLRDLLNDLHGQAVEAIERESAPGYCGNDRVIRGPSADCNAFLLQRVVGDRSGYVVRLLALTGRQICRNRVRVLEQLNK